MINYILTITLLLFFTCCGDLNNKDTSIIQYQQKKHLLEADGNLDLVYSVFTESNEEDVILKAIEDALELLDQNTAQVKPDGGLRDGDAALSSEEITQTIPVLQGYMKKLQKRFPPESAVYQESVYADAVLLLLSDKVDESIELYKKARKNRWQFIEADYEDTLIEHIGWEKSIILYYNLKIDDTYTDADQRNFFDRFFSYMVHMKHQKPYTKMMDVIYPNLDRSPEHPEFDEIALALCLLADREYEQAKKILAHLDSKLSKLYHKGHVSEQYRNIPIYQAAVIYLQDPAQDELDDYVQTFWERNANDPGYVIHFASVFYHWRLGQDYNIHITQFFADAGFFENPEIIEQIEVDRLTHIMDLHLQGLFYNEIDMKAAEKLATTLTTNYFPETAGSVNAMWLLGFIYQRNGQIAKAEEAYIRIITESPYDVWINRSESDLIELWMNNHTKLEVILQKIKEFLKIPGTTQQERLEKLERKVRSLFR